LTRNFYLSVLAIALSHQPFAVTAAAQQNTTSLVRAGNFLFAPISINHGPATWWLVDTGAPASEIDVEAARALHLLPVATRMRNPHFGPDEQPNVQVNNLSVGSCSTGGARLIVKMLSELNRGSLPVGWSGAFNRDGLIGLDLLLRQNAIVDWSTQQIILTPPNDLARTRQAYESKGFTYIPLLITAGNHLEIAGSLGNGEYRFYVDTGNPKTLLRQSVVEFEKLPSEITHAEIHSPLHNFEDARVSSVTTTGWRLGSFSMGEQKVHSANFNLAASEGGSSWAGLIGADSLWAHDAVLDIGKRALYLRTKPSVRSDLPGAN
jgi:hypothetical protein